MSQSLTGPQAKEPRVEPTKGARFISPICEAVKLYGGSVIQPDSVVVMTVDQAVMTP